MAKSNADSKLRNIDAIKKMLSGTHQFQTKTSVSFQDITAPAPDRQVGDVWTDKDGIEWEQRKGYKMNKGKFDDLRAELNSFPKCRKETCTCIKPERLDYKMRGLHGMCFDCVVDMEHDLKITGKYAEYERNKMKKNAMGWLKDSEQEVIALKVAVTKAPEFVTVDGQVNKWEMQYDPEKMAASIDAQFNEMKSNIFKNYGVTEEEFIEFKQSQ